MMNMMEAPESASDAEFAAKGAKTPLWSGAAYSSAIGKSMRAMMTSSRLRGGRLAAAAAGKDAGVELFADAVARKDKEKMLDALAKDPGVMRRGDEVRAMWVAVVARCLMRDMLTRGVEERLAAAASRVRAAAELPIRGSNDDDDQHVSGGSPMCRQGSLWTEKWLRTKDGNSNDCCWFNVQNGRTPLHTLCENSCVTVQALRAFAVSLAELTLVQDNGGNLPLHYLCRNSSCDIGLIDKLASDTSAYMTINNVSPLSANSSHICCGLTLIDFYG
ncbi:unnamed protein product [Phytophthora fragariaefolia]|uniref:Unnamed protein product n=1 Tax=Phytophthora fragariaefolia TaxID=1490495 RepID=A0A9W6U3A8_9STRA|nr:unnamed protein product [Phytophthora fragariaefolia]